MNLDEWRSRINNLDQEILNLLNQRGQVALQIGELKRQQELPYFVPERESQVLDRLVALNRGPLTTEAVRAIWREILSASLALEHALTVAYLGPPGTFTHQAAERRFGSSATLVPVRTILLSHPGNCLGYRLEHAGRRICYVTDNELYPADSPFRQDEYVERLADFCRDADVLITDCTYADVDYPRHVHWGHSSVSQVAELAWRAHVRTLSLVHHDPSQNDDAIDAKLAATQAWLAERGADTQVTAPAERSHVQL